MIKHRLIRTIFIAVVMVCGANYTSASQPVMTWSDDRGFISELGTIPDTFYQLSSTTITRVLNATTTVYAPSAPSDVAVSVVPYDGDGEPSCYSTSGGTTDYEIYAYKTDGGGTKVFSTEHADLTYVSPDEDGNPFIARISWDASSDLETDGYEIYSDVCSESGLHGKDVGNVTSYDDLGAGYEDASYPPSPNIGENPAYYTSNIDTQDRTQLSSVDGPSSAIADGEIAVSHPDGSVTGFIPYQDDDVSRGFLLLNVASSSVAGDVLYLSPHVFEVSLDSDSVVTGVIDETRGDTGSISIHGSGVDRTYFKSNRQFIRFASGSQTTDLNIVSTHSPGLDSSPFMDGNSPVPISNASIRNVVTVAQADGIFTFRYLRNNLDVYNLTCFSKQDCINWGASTSAGPGLGGTLNVYHSSLTSVASTSIGAGLYARSILVSDGIVNVFNSTLSASEGSDLNCGVAKVGGTISIYGGSITGDICNGTVNITPSTQLLGGTSFQGVINTISPILPIISTSTPSQTTATSTTLNATLDTDGGATTTIEGFDYGTTVSYGSTVYDTGEWHYNDFSASIADLSCGTTYHYRAVAVNDIGTTTASDQTFTTSACPQSEQATPTVTTTNHSGRSSYGSMVSIYKLASILTPSASTTEYLNSRGLDLTKVNVTTGGWLTRDLYLGITGQSVKELQRYLNSLGAGFVVATYGPGSSGNETTYFGPLTRNALARFQKANGINPTHGYFGPITRKYILSILAK